MKQASPSSERDLHNSVRSPAEKSLAMFYVGLNIHAKRSLLCILDDTGKPFKRKEVKGLWSARCA
jgi:hypothetical protein